jgi:hypothetical protein
MRKSVRREDPWTWRDTRSPTRLEMPTPTLAVRGARVSGPKGGDAPGRPVQSAAGERIRGGVHGLGEDPIVCPRVDIALVERAGELDAQVVTGGLPRERAAGSELVERVRIEDVAETRRGEKVDVRCGTVSAHVLAIESAAGAYLDPGSEIPLVLGEEPVLLCRKRHFWRRGHSPVSASREESRPVRVGEFAEGRG